MRFWLKGCPKCGGDLELKQDIEGSYIECMQCGGELTPIEDAFLRRLGRVPKDLPHVVPPPVLTEGRRHSA